MIIFTIAARELRSLFLSPLAWSILSVVHFILTYFFLLYVEQFIKIQPGLAQYPNAPGVTEIVVAPLFDTAGLILLLVMPILTMRLISEERRNRTLALLFSAPVSMTEIILGKYIGILSFTLIIVALLSLMPLSLLSGTNLDIGLMFSGLLGLVLLVSSFAAVGLYMSSLTTQPTIAAISTFGILLLLWILDAAGSTGDESDRIFSYLSILRHFQPMLKGVFDSSDIIYYLLFITTFLVLSIRRLDADRLQH